ncbi:MAG: 2-amino-4-hydroxy-6-hydroxymethyldihydropteridine diphosphokinase [Gracilibacteraceae bacterium]|jgi:2-amino-4-hydroxy-6-hydroxymethyldihydropteridine diphosphokinase|nr:2-amino-4-hydroxy-6-hydroxymethyldihydropteridine diphosphokinase [Gracilibacteraceae bacterium]
MTPSEITGYLSLGSNVEPREDHLRRALAELDRSAGLRLLRVSSFYVTEPWGGVPQADFYNLAAAVATTLAPRELLAVCQRAEDRLGRRRDGPRWGPREIDIDILLLGDIVWHDESLTIPHPFLTERAFVLTPLREIAPDLRLPGGELVAGLEGTGRARKLNYP